MRCCSKCVTWYGKSLVHVTAGRATSLGRDLGKLRTE
jgi:hypothetical protein